MSYPFKPNKIGLTQLFDVNIREIVPFIHWTFFFMAWRLNGKFDGIESVCDCNSCKTGWLQKFSVADRPKAEEAIKLYKDAQEFLRKFLSEKIIQINATVAIYPAKGIDDDIVIEYNGVSKILPTLRQQQPATDGFCYALADFIAPENDYVGVFATTILGADEYAAEFEKTDDMYNSILIKTLSDRLAEASAEWLHYKVRKEIWGYVPDEKIDVKEMFKTHYSGIRPAVGYPSLPDQSIIFELDSLIKFKDMGIQLTENGAMYPNASVSGLYFSHPKSKYFNIGKIDEKQFADYAQRCGKTTDALRKWMAANL